MEEPHVGVSPECLHRLLGHPSMSSIPAFPISTSDSTTFQKSMKNVKSHSIQCSCLLLVCRNILLPSLPPSLSTPSSLYSVSNVRSVFSRQCDVCKQEGQLYIKHIIASSASDASKIQPAIITRSHHAPASVALLLLMHALLFRYSFFPWSSFPLLPLPYSLLTLSLTSHRGLFECHFLNKAFPTSWI